MTIAKLKKLLVPVTTILLLAPSIAIGQRFAGPVTSRRIKFEKGRTTAAIKGVAKTPGTYEYLLRVRSGQTMSVHLTSSNKGVEFSIEAPNGDWVDDALGVTDWSGRLESSGDHKILLTNNRSKVQRNPKYTLEVTVR
jgi:hypothetical protein